MKWTPWLFGSLAAVLVAGCGGERRNDGTGTPDAGTESGTRQGGTGTTVDTALPTPDTSAGTATRGTSSDTAHGGTRIHQDTNRPSTGAGAGEATDTVQGGDRARSATDTAGTSNH
jgi:hypothetical protein